MLRHLDIRDMLIIDHLALDFAPGLNVLTGETGAGKSILLDSLGFVLGWRGRADLVRQSADRGEVTAVFDVADDADLRDLCGELGIDLSEGELILRRVNHKDGRKTAWVNERRVSGEGLRRLSEHLIELHGQHDDRGLLNAKGHRDLLDQFGQFAPLKDDVATAWRHMRKAERALDAAKLSQDELREEEEYLRHSVKELTDLSPEKGEDEKLDAERRLMQSAEKIAGDISKAAQAIGSGGAQPLLGDALRWLDTVAGQADGHLDQAVETLGRAINELADAQSDIDRAMDVLRFDPLTLEACEERLFAIRGLARKHNVQPDALAELTTEMAAKLDALDAGGQDIATLEQALTDTRATYEAAAARLSDARQTAASALDQLMAEELAPLKMERAVFTTIIAPSDPSRDGIDTVAFEVATNPGAPSGPLAKIASGGELSRFLLALKVCLTRHQSQVTMIFDEIDRGVGGATADAVGRRLHRLAQGGQVLVVTHSPQVAALGVQHFEVSKEVVADETFSRVHVLSEGERVDEIARMVSGDTLTDAARDAARALLAG